MSWEIPDRSWQFRVGDDPPENLPTAWASASRAVTRDLSCRRHGRHVTFDNVMWRIVTDHGAVAVGFTLTGDADIRAYERCLGYQLETTSAQATVWVAGSVQDELTGYEFVQWPISGQHILLPRVIDQQAVWTDPITASPVAAIGSLCQEKTAECAGKSGDQI